MRCFEILICDNDKQYVNDFIEYLMENKANFSLMISVTGCSDIKEFKDICGNFDIGFLEKDFYEYLNLVDRNISVKRCVLLTEDREELEGIDSFFKYQSMEAIDTMLKIKSNPINNNNGVSIYMIYSPSKHELSLEFSLCICKVLSSDGNLLFLDLSEIGILHKLMGINVEEDLLDAIYMLENDEKIDLNKYIYEFEGFNVFAPVLTPAQLPYITLEQWGRLFERIKKLNMNKLIILCGTLVQGFSEFIEKSEKLFTLNGVGEYYSVFEDAFLEYIDKLGMSSKIVKVILPFTAANLSMKGFRLDSMINGKMMEHAKETLKGNGLDEGYKTTNQTASS